jgi:hypothetical protein
MRLGTPQEHFLGHFVLEEDAGDMPHQDVLFSLILD